MLSPTLLVLQGLLSWKMLEKKKRKKGPSGVRGRHRQREREREVVKSQNRCLLFFLGWFAPRLNIDSGPAVCQAIATHRSGQTGAQRRKHSFLKVRFQIFSLPPPPHWTLGEETIPFRDSMHGKRTHFSPLFATDISFWSRPAWRGLFACVWKRTEMTNARLRSKGGESIRLLYLSKYTCVKGYYGKSKSSDPTPWLKSESTGSKMHSSKNYILLFSEINRTIHWLLHSGLNFFITIANVYFSL